MDLDLLTAVADLMGPKTEWPNAHELEADQFSDLTREMICKRLNVDDDTGHQIAVKVWRHLRNE